MTTHKDINHIPRENKLALYYRVGLCGFVQTRASDEQLPRHWIAESVDNWVYFSQQSDEDVCELCVLIQMTNEVEYRVGNKPHT